MPVLQIESNDFERAQANKHNGSSTAAAMQGVRQEIHQGEPEGTHTD